jgi:hypothetical protein
MRLFICDHHQRGQKSVRTTYEIHIWNCLLSRFSTVITLGSYRPNVISRFNSSQSFLLNKQTGDKESLFTHEVVKNQVDCSYENMT